MTKKRLSSTQIKRRKETRPLILKGYTTAEIANKLNCSQETTRKDVDYWNKYYLKLAINNPHIVERQVLKVESLLAEAELIKKEYWDLNQEIKDRVLSGKKEIDLWLKKRAKLILLEEEATTDEKKKEATIAIKCMGKKPTINLHFRDRLETLKTIMSRVEGEARLLNMFNPTTLLKDMFIHEDVVKGIMKVFKTIIADLIPENQRKYAYSRLQTIDVNCTSTKTAVNNEFDKVSGVL